MAATITTLYKSYVSGQEVGIISVSIPPADVKTLNSIPIDIIAAPGLQKAVLITEAIFRIDTYGGTPYATDTSLSLVYDTGLDIINQFTGRLATAGICIFTPSFTVSMACAHSGSGFVESNKKVQLCALSANPTAGNSTIIIYISYKIIPSN